MAWEKTAADFMADMLRMSIRVCIFIDGIMIALASMWVCWKLLYFSIMFLNRTLFSSPW